MALMRDFIRKVYSKENLKALVFLIPLLYALVYGSVFFSGAFSTAKKYIGENQAVIAELGEPYLIIPAFSGPSETRINSQGGTASYMINVVGPTNAGQVAVRLTSDGQTWAVTSAVLIDRENHFVVLLSEPTK